MKLSDYKTLVFDCDGVILNSNKVKTNAFFNAAMPYGEAAATQLVDFHIARGGISRYKKFEWFLDEVVKGSSGPNLTQLLKAYAEEVYQGLIECEVTKNLAELRVATANANWLIVSGGDQAELNEVFEKRELSQLFDGGIFGSPDNKFTILGRELSSGSIQQPALFVGDSQYDFEASSSHGLSFCFVHAWSEFLDWESYFQNKDVLLVDSVYQLLETNKE